MCRGTTRAANYRTKNKDTKGNAGAVCLSDLVVAVARLDFTADPALPALLAASPGATFNPDVQVLDWAITVDGSYVATKVMFTGEGAAAGWVRARVGLGPVRVVGLPMSLEIEGASEGSRTIGALVLLLRIIGYQLDLVRVHT